MRLRVLICFLFLPALLGAERNILQEEVRNNEALIAEIKRLNKREQLGNADGIILQWQADTDLMRERNAKFKGYASSRQFAVYAERQDDAERYLKEAHSVLALFEKLFPKTNFLPATPAQILIYNNEFDYIRYEKLPQGVVGHTHATRSKKKSIVRHGSVYSIEAVTSSNIKDHRLATYRQDVAYVFAHEVSHILTYELVNPGRMSSVKDVEASLFLNEGLAEYFSARLHPEGFQKRLGVLRDAYKLTPESRETDIKGLPVEKFLDQDSYPNSAQVLAFYSEATLFVQWLMQLPDGSELVSAMLVTADPDKMEAEVRHHQRKFNLPVTGFDEYQPYRRRVLLDFKKKPESEAAAPQVSPAAP